MKKSKLKPFTWVKYDIPKGYDKSYPFERNELLLFLNEISNMPGHCVLANREGKLLIGYHTDELILAKEDEI
jgi:hypothetical protein